MNERDYRDYLNDIFESTKEIESFIEGITFDEFLKDKMTINAVVRSIVEREQKKH